MATDATNVSLGKPKIGGAIYNAPLGTTLPTDATGTLNSSFVCLGYVSDDGLTNENGLETDTIKAWGGDEVLVIQSDKTDTFTFTLLEVLNVDVLKAVYKSSNVSGSLSTGITVRVNSEELDASCWVFDMVMNKNTLKRVVIPNGKISELGEIVYKDDEAVGYQITLTAMPGDSDFGYDTHKEYIIRSQSNSGTSGTSGSN